MAFRLMSPTNGDTSSTRWRFTCRRSGEQHINDENSVSLIPTDSLPLVIVLNDHTLRDYPQEARSYALERASATRASIRGEESEQVELLNIRRGNSGRACSQPS